MEITERFEAETTILAVDGRLTMQSSHLLLDCFKEKMQSSHPILVNLEAVDYMDSSGVGVLVTALKLAKGKDIRFGLIGINHRVQVVMEMSGLTTLFEIYPDEAAALKALAE